MMSSILFSCADQSAVPLVDKLTVNYESEVRGSDPCAYEGSCINLEELTIFYYPPLIPNCQFQITMDVTRCIDPLTGVVTYYFKDENLALITTGNCGPLDGEDVDNAYAFFIEYFINTNPQVSIPGCSSGSTVISKHVKSECTRLCRATEIGTESYVYQNCSDELFGCCVQTSEYCRDASGAVQATLLASSDFTLGCRADVIACGPIKDLTAYAVEDCGARCDR